MMEINRRTQDSLSNMGLEKSALELGDSMAIVASVAISLIFRATPLLPVEVATGFLGLFGGSILLVDELALDWKNSRQKATGNGFHYLLKIKGR